MGVWEIIVIVVCSLFAISVITAMIIMKKQGKTSCDCGCSSCHCSACKNYKKSNNSK